MELVSDLVARFLGPLWAWIEATPVHVLLVCFVALLLFGFISVCESLPQTPMLGIRGPSRS